MPHSSWRARGIPLPRPTCREQELAAVRESIPKGFTLAEVLIVTVILGILAGLAIPSYTNSVEQSRANEAQANLNIIYTAEKIYKVNNGTFWEGGTNPPIANINATLNIDLAPPKFYPIASIEVTGSGATEGFTATATRNEGGWVGRSASINEVGVYTAP